MAHEFLSDDWMDAVEALAGEAPEATGPAADVKINMVVTDCPFGEREAHMTGGRIERGLLDDAPTTLTVPFTVAKKLFVDNDQQAAMQAFMSGQIKVQGDMTKLMAMQSGGGPTPEQDAFAKKIQELTA